MKQVLNKVPPRLKSVMQPVLEQGWGQWGLLPCREVGTAQEQWRHALELPPPPPWFQALPPWLHSTAPPWPSPHPSQSRTLQALRTQERDGKCTVCPSFCHSFMHSLTRTLTHPLCTCASAPGKPGWRRVGLGEEHSWVWPLPTTRSVHLLQAGRTKCPEPIKGQPVLLPLHPTRSPFHLAPAHTLSFLL